MTYRWLTRWRGRGERLSRAKSYKHGGCSKRRFEWCVDNEEQACAISKSLWHSGIVSVIVNTLDGKRIVRTEYL